MQQTPTDSNPDSAKADILIVDDTPLNLRLLNTILTNAGYMVRAAANGPAALQAAQSLPPDLVLLDITMPQMDGYEVCTRLKADPHTRDVPVIFISALDATEDKVRAFTTGGVDYITKPFQMEEVLARVETHLSLRAMQVLLETMNQDLEERVRQRTAELVALNQVMERFVPRDFLTYLGKENLVQFSLGDQVRREMTVLFSDIRGFTSRVEQMRPEESFSFINDYLRYTGPVVRQHGGFVDKYLGDGMMALFPHSPDDAINAAIAIHGSIAQFNQDLQTIGREPITSGISLNTGAPMLGVIGEEQRWQGTVIGDAVNLAARLEPLNKHYGASTLITGQTFEKLKNRWDFHIRFLDRVQVRGRHDLVDIYEVFDSDPEPLRSAKEAGRERFELAVRFLLAGQPEPAKALLQALAAAAPDDHSVRYHLEKL